MLCSVCNRRTAAAPLASTYGSEEVREFGDKAFPFSWKRASAGGWLTRTKREKTHWGLTQTLTRTKVLRFHTMWRPGASSFVYLLHKAMSVREGAGDPVLLLRRVPTPFRLQFRFFRSTFWKAVVTGSCAESV